MLARLHSKLLETKLHRLLSDRALTSVVLAELWRKPEASTRETEYGCLPLHTAAANNASEMVVKELIHAYPAAARAKNNEDGWLPLHYAAAIQASEAVLLVLLEEYPEGDLEKDKNGDLPLQIATDNASAVQKLLEAHEAAARKTEQS